MYQRAQILSWQRPEKVQLFAELGIKVVVNFWPKLDPDLSDSGLGWYWYIPADRSMEMLEPRIHHAAEALARFLVLAPPKTAALILCEAGKTRSVFFSALLIHHMEHVSLAEAHARVVEAVPTHSLKGFMVDYLTRPRRQPVVLRK